MSIEQTNPTLQKLREYQNRTLTPKEILTRMVLTAVIIFAAGFILTTALVHLSGYPSLPVQGETRIQANGEPAFLAYYPFFNRYAIVNEGEVMPKESAFDKIGAIGVGTYFYTTINAPHWILEVNAPFMIFDLVRGNLRGLELIPYFITFLGMVFFVKVMIPRQRLTPQSVLNYSIIISLFHSFLVIFILLAAVAISPTYSSMYENFKFYKGQFVGAVLPGVFLILLYGLFIGGVVGSIMSGFLYYFYLTLIFFGIVKPPQSSTAN